MRTLAIIAAISGAPAPGLYCPLEAGGMPILVDARGIGIDGLDCERPVYAGGRVRADRCYANGGTVVTLDEPLAILEDGALVHDGQFYRRREAGPPCD